MKYQRPQIEVAGEARTAVASGSTNKDNTNCKDGGGGTRTHGAYEVDE
jgi:hypothetical protein